MRSLFIVALCAPSAALFACDKDKGSTEAPAKDGLAVVPPTYGATSNVPNEAREKCKFDDDLGDELVEAIPGAGLSTSAAADKRLVVEVTRITGAEATWEGAISVILEGTLESHGEPIGNFRLKRSTLGGVAGGMGAVCRGLDRLAEETALDIADFVAHPKKDVDIGE